MSIPTTHQKTMSLVLALLLIAGILSPTTAFVPASRPFGITTTRLCAYHHNNNYDNSNAGGGNKDTFDMEELKQRIAQSDPYAIFHDIVAQPQSPPPSSQTTKITNHKQQKVQKQQQQMQKNKEQHPLLQEAYIIVFEGPEQEGVHTIEYPPGSGQNVILAFASSDAASKFAAELTQVLPDHQIPILQKVQMDFLEDFCKDLGVYAQVVPEGMDIRPPQKTVKELGQHATFDLREQQKHLEYVFDMAEGVDELEDEGVLAMNEGNYWE